MTIDYYNRNAQAFEQRTRDADIGEMRDEFLSLLPPAAHVLDAGCGPGRDMAVFLQRGFHVTAIDPSPAMCDLAEKASGQRPLLKTLQEIEFDDIFGGIWAMASLLHVPTPHVDDVVDRLIRAMKIGGVMYISVKSGDGERINKDGRLFNDYTEQAMRAMLKRHPKLEIIRIWETPPRPNQCDGGAWVHALTRKSCA